AGANRSRGAAELGARAGQTGAPVADRVPVGRRPGLPYLTPKPEAPGPLVERALDRVQRPPLDLPLDPAQVLADERQDEPLHAEDEQDGDAAEQGAREVRAVDPIADPVAAECEREHGADHAESDPDPRDRLRPAARQHRQRAA